MIKFTDVKCPNCGAEIELNSEGNTFNCQYCGSTIYIENDVVRTLKKYFKEKDEIDEKCQEVSEKFNQIFQFYDGSKNEMLLMLKEKVGLVSSNKTLAKYTMMKSSPYFVDEPFDNPFTYRIDDRILDHFEFKSDFSIELTYDTEDDDAFAIEYYGRVTKYNDIDELIRVLDEIIEEVKIKFNK